MLALHFFALNLRLPEAMNLIYDRKDYMLDVFDFDETLYSLRQDTADELSTYFV